MSIRGKIIAFQIFFVCMVLVLFGVVFFAVERADYYIERVSQTHRQLEAITELSVRANRYSEQIAEMLLFGEEGREEFEDARRELSDSFRQFETLTIDEIQMLGNDPEAAMEREELIAVDRMRRVTRQMHETALELLELKLGGREDDARLRYFAEIEEDQDDELQRLIDLAVADEQQEVRSIDARTQLLARELIIVLSVATCTTVVASFVAVALLSRSLSKPIGRLTEGAEAIGSGRLSHRIMVQGGDELGRLSKHFNQMAEQLQNQRHELLNQQALLERKVGERTAELESANRRLEKLDRLRVLFLAEVSHELRTPLTVLRGEAEITLRGREMAIERYREALERVVDQASHMSRLVDDLLFLSRAEADSIRFEINKVNLCDVLNEACEDGRVLARAFDVDLAASWPDEPLQIWGDGARLRQVGLIGIENAIKYAYPESVIDVELVAAGEEAVLCVRNQGKRIPSEDLPYVFERFYRGPQNGGRPAGGSGLGLSIAKWIVEKHGGTIGLASHDDGLTELSIRLPRS